VRYLEFLSRMHEVLDPGTYLEVGIRNGNSLSLSRCPSIAIDPDFTMTAELAAPVWVFRTTSDEYFSRPAPLAPFDGKPVDFAFIDGMHLSDFALRDFMGVERNSAPWTVVVFDDIFPGNVDHAARDRHTKVWTGDVFKIIDVFRTRRPDLKLTFVNTTPTGLLMIHGLDSANRTLEDNYDEIYAEMVRPDPQVVPQETFDRAGALEPEEALALGVWSELRAARPGGGDEARKRIAITPRRALKGPVDVVRLDLGGDDKPAEAKTPAPAAAHGNGASRGRPSMPRRLARAIRGR
jgi:hypothetical protein